MQAPVMYVMVLRLACSVFVVAQFVESFVTELR